MSFNESNFDENVGIYFNMVHDNFSKIITRLKGFDDVMDKG